MANSNNPKRSGNAKGTKKLRLRSRKAGEVQQSYWSNINPDHVTSATDVVTRSGGALMFTRSSDGGALGLRVYHDDFLLETLWGTDRGEMQDILADIWENFTEVEDGEAQGS